jgi:hypothetical protein
MVAKSEMRRLAVTMWEFSWLVRRSGHQAEYADWGRVLDELVDRGYNCIRLDAFPHLIGRDANISMSETFSILPQDDTFPWGNHETVSVQPAKGLIEFLTEMKARGLTAGLSSWYNDDETHQRDNVKTPDDFARIWLRTLDLVASHDLLDTVEWVDICNEFPLPLWMPAAYSNIFMQPAESVSLRKTLNAPWSKREIATASEYLTQSISPLKTKYPQLRYTASFVYGACNLQDLDTSEFGLLEPHIWVALDQEWSDNTEHAGALKREPQGIRRHYERVKELLPNNREDQLKKLEPLLDTWVEIAAAKKLPLVTTEAWGPINYDDLTHDGGSAEWDWVKDICAEGVRMAIRKGWTGICTSNFCQPHFKGMWSDVEWHRQLTSEILQKRASDA